MKINKTVLMSGADYFGDEFAINALMDSSVAVNKKKALLEHQTIQKDFEKAGIRVVKVDAPRNCQDGVYTANWGLCLGKRCVLSSLPNKRQAEESYAASELKRLGKQLIKPPFRFSGQGDCLPCGNLLFCGSTYRTDPRMHEFLAKELGFAIIGLQTIPQLDSNNKPVVNAVTGWPDSFFYDLDLALAVINVGLIAWCPEAFDKISQKKIRALGIDKIEVSFEEAKQGFACNLVSTGEVVVMSAHSPKLQAAIRAKGLKTITPEVTELVKGGGFIRCISLTIDNE